MDSSPTWGSRQHGVSLRCSLALTCFLSRSVSLSPPSTLALPPVHAHACSQSLSLIKSLKQNKTGGQTEDLRREHLNLGSLLRGHCGDTVVPVGVLVASTLRATELEEPGWLCHLREALALREWFSCEMRCAHVGNMPETASLLTEIGLIVFSLHPPPHFLGTSSGKV